eukprot:196091-Alexandrium_andersonii.AAC.1
MRAFSDVLQRRVQLRPEWDVQAVRLDNEWVLAVGDHDETPTMKDVAVRLQGEDLDAFERRLEQLWPTWGGRVPPEGGQ